MNAEQKRAWLAVGSMVAVAIAYFVMLPFLGPRASLSAFALFGVNGIAPLIGRKEHLDERDRSIVRLATGIGAMCSYLGFYAATMGVWIVVFAVQRERSVSVHVFPTMAIVAGMVPLILGRAIVVLVLYGRHTEASDV